MIYFNQEDDDIKKICEYYEKMIVAKERRYKERMRDIFVAGFFLGMLVIVLASAIVL